MDAISQLTARQLTALSSANRPYSLEGPDSISPFLVERGGGYSMPRTASSGRAPRIIRAAWQRQACGGTNPLPVEFLVTRMQQAFVGPDQMQMSLPQFPENVRVERLLLAMQSDSPVATRLA